PEQVGALSIASVVSRNRRREWDEEQPALFVDGEVERPGVGAQPALPALALPGVVADRSWLRHRTEFPQLGAGACIVGARVADAADGALRGVRADDHDVAIDLRHRV